MASLTDVYDGHVRTVTTARRVSLGASVFVVGVAMVVGSVGTATTAVGAQFGLDLIEARRLAGILAGVGLPAAILGVFTVLPASRAARAAAAIGASLSVLGVTLFSVAYPTHWFETGASALALASLLVYFAGAITTLGCLFTALATFKTRNDPGGTAKMHLTESGTVRLVEDTFGTDRGLGGVGLFGTDPDGDVTTQTNRSSPPRSTQDTAPEDTAEVLTDTDDTSGRSKTPGGQAATADGGSATVENQPADDHDRFDPAMDDAEFLDAATERGRPDAYCGNCAHFEYVKVDGEIEPYCGLASELMDEMDACSEWVERD